jgi:methyl-accepting chemotaxis protein
MDKVTQQNAANAEESASASEELSAQAESMKEVVSQLMAMVGGAGSQTVRSGGTKPERQSVHMDIEKQFHAVSKPKSKPRSSGKSDKGLPKVAARMAKPERQMIPLGAGDGDLDEFNN